jgi:hypothetical protein
MKKNFIYFVVNIVVFILYFQILKVIWNKYIPWNIGTDLIGLFIFILVNIPLSVITTEFILKMVKKNLKLN